MEVHVLRVFVDGDGRHGNSLGVVVDGQSVAPDERQPLAARLGYSETVFVDDRERGAIRIFTPAAELPFAGHPAVGTAWLLDAGALEPPAGRVPVTREGALTWIAGRPEWSPAFEHVQLASPAQVDAHPIPTSGLDAVWAWEDEADGRVRSRVFPVAIGVDEDEATGSAAMLLAAALERELEIRQGRGSLIVARPRPDGLVEIGGRVVVDTVIDV